MKIYKSKSDQSKQETNKIFDFEGTLEEKIDNFLLSFTDIKLDEGLYRSIFENVFGKFGYSIHFPRKGDVNERFDILFEKEGLSILTEVEIPSNAILDAPRNLLDDLAVFSNRRNISLENLQALVICWEIPNRRTDYWNVIDDIQKVIGVKIHTISLVSLLILFWTEQEFDISDYFVTVEDIKLENITNILIENNIDAYKYLGYFSPLK